MVLLLSSMWRDFRPISLYLTKLYVTYSFAIASSVTFTVQYSEIRQNFSNSVLSTILSELFSKIYLKRSIFPNDIYISDFCIAFWENQHRTVVGLKICYNFFTVWQIEFFSLVFLQVIKSKVSQPWQFRSLRLLFQFSFYK